MWLFSNSKPRLLRLVPQGILSGLRLLGVALGVLLMARPASPATTCLALFVGNNTGLTQESPLRFAATDARKISDLFRNSSAFPKTEITVLADAGVDRLRAELGRVRTRAAALKQAGETVVLLFFYSGHGSAQSLHLAGGEFPRAELQGLYAAREFDVRILILDACESGDFLRQKGDSSAPTHDFSAAGDVEARGTMVLSSTARGEYAQESEEYGEGVFSHHLLNALRGLGDFNGDSKVTVLEAFDYAQASTRGERIVGRTQMQNPGFDLDLVGMNDVALIDLAARKSSLILEDFPFGDAEIYDAYSSRLVDRVRLTGKKNISFLLRPGNYVLSFRNEGRAGYCAVALPSDRPCRVKAASIRNMPEGEGMGKGKPFLPFLHYRMESSVRLCIPIRGGRFPVFEVGYAYSLSPRTEVGMGLGFGRERAPTSGSILNVDSRFVLMETDLRIAVWQERKLGLWCGAGGGVWLLDQEIRDGRLFAGQIETEDGVLRPVRHARSAILRLRAPLSIRFRPHPRVLLAGEVDACLHGYDRSPGNGYSILPGSEQGISLGISF